MPKGIPFFREISYNNLVKSAVGSDVRHRNGS